MRRMNELHWIKHSHLFDPDEYECSHCGAIFKKKYRVCPNCGTSLGLEKEEQDWVDEAEELSWILMMIEQYECPLGKEQDSMIFDAQAKNRTDSG